MEEYTHATNELHFVFAAPRSRGQSGPAVHAELFHFRREHRDMRTNGSVKIARREWRGADAFKRYNEDRRLTVPDASAFCASWCEARVDGVQFGAWSTSPITGVESPVGTDGGAVLIAVTSGTVRYWVDGRSESGGAGSVHLVSGSARIRFAVDEPSRLLRILIPSAALPKSIRNAMRSVGPVTAGRISFSLTLMVEEVLDPAGGGTASPAGMAVRPLAIAAIEESLNDLAGPTPTLDLRRQLLDHIDQRLVDPGLSPRTIAAHFGLSLRSVHGAFSDSGTSIARRIRERRLDIVAGHLYADPRLVSISALAERVGFSTSEQLKRAFRARYSMTLHEYANLSIDGGAPLPLIAAG